MCVCMSVNVLDTCDEKSGEKKKEEEKRNIYIYVYSDPVTSAKRNGHLVYSCMSHLLADEYRVKVDVK